MIPALRAATQLEADLPPALPDALDQAWQAALGQVPRELVPLCLLGQARARRMLGQDRDAEALAEQALTQLEEVAVPSQAQHGQRGQAWWLLAQTALDRGDSRTAHDRLLQCMAWFKQAGDPRGLADAARAYGEHLAVLGAREEARAGLTLAWECYRALGDTETAQWVEQQLASVGNLPAEQGCKACGRCVSRCSGHCQADAAPAPAGDPDPGVPDE